MPKETIYLLKQHCEAYPQLCESWREMFEGTITDLYSEAHLGNISVNKSGNLFTVRVKMEHHGLELVHIRNYLGLRPDGNRVFSAADDDFYAMKHYLDMMKVAELKPANTNVICLMHEAEAFITAESQSSRKTLQMSWESLEEMAYSNDHSRLLALFE